MSVSFFDDEIDNREVFEITQDDIEQCHDVHQLVEWHSAILEVKDDIQADISARVATGKETDLWLFRVSRKLGFLGRGESRIRRRLKALGHDPIWEVEQVNALRRQLALAKAEATYGREYVRAAQDLLSADYQEEIHRRAIAVMEAAASSKREAA